MLYEDKEFTLIKGYTKYFICRETTEVLSIKDRKNTYKNTYKILKQVPNSKNPSCNYFLVTLVDDEGKRKNRFIHRLMAETFIPNPNNKPQVNHIDGNKQNNNVSNLEWSTVALNTQHGYNYSAYSNIRKVKSIEMDGTIHVFPSTSHAARYYNYSNPTTIQAILEGRKSNPITRGIRQGLYFEYTNESVTTIERVAITVDSE